MCSSFKDLVEEMLTQANYKLILVKKNIVVVFRKVAFKYYLNFQVQVGLYI